MTVKEKGVSSINIVTVSVITALVIVAGCLILIDRNKPITGNHERPDLEACLPQSGLSTIESIGEYGLGGIYCAYASATYEYSTAAIFEFKTSEDAKTAFWNEFHANNTYSLTSVQGYESAAVGEGDMPLYAIDIDCLGVSGKYVVIVVGYEGATRAIDLLASVNIPQNILYILIVGISICLFIVAVILIWIRRR